MATTSEERLVDVLLSKIANIDGIHEISALTPLKILRFRHDVFLGESTPFIPSGERNTKTKIIEILSENARMTNKEIADRLCMTEGNVRHHLATMIKNGQIRIAAAVNALAYGYGSHVLLRLSITPKELDRVCDTLLDHPEIGLIAVTSGRYNIFCNISGAQKFSLPGFVNNLVSDMPGLVSFHTTEITQTLKFNTNVARIL